MGCWEGRTAPPTPDNAPPTPDNAPPTPAGAQQPHLVVLRLHMGRAETQLYLW